MINTVDSQYLQIADEILTKGKLKNNRTGVKTYNIFGGQAKFDLSNGFPLLTTKKVHFYSVIHELLWFIKGDTNIKYLVDNNVHIWDGDCYRNYVEKYNELRSNTEDFSKNFTGTPPEQFTKEEFIDKIKNDNDFADKWGELGNIYGKMWRTYPYFIHSGQDEDFLNKEKLHCLPYGDLNQPNGGKTVFGNVDQIHRAINLLKTDPDSRRIIVNAWHPYWADNCCLPPCHLFYQFNTEELTTKERWEIYEKLTGISEYDWKHHVDSLGVGDKELDNPMTPLKIPKRKLNCLFFCRSQDFPLGTPFNLASYGLLTHMIAQTVNMVPGTLVWTAGDIDIYENQIDGIKEQLRREPKQLPEIKLNKDIKNIFDFKFSDIELLNYNPHPTIKMPVSNG